MFKMQWLFLIIIVLFVSMVVLRLTGPPSNFASGYSTCKEASGACPTTIGGRGWPCSNANAVCEQGPPGEEDLRCKTKSHWFYVCTCECGC